MRNHFSHVHFRVLYKRKMVDKCMEVFLNICYKKFLFIRHEKVHVFDYARRD